MTLNNYLKRINIKIFSLMERTYFGCLTYFLWAQIATLHVSNL